MATTVTVALAGDPAEPMRGLTWPDDWEIPYEERPKLDLDVDDDETLGSVLLRAAAGFNVEAPDWAAADLLQIVTRIEFHDPERPFQLGKELALLDSTGRVRFTWRWKDEPYSEIMRAGGAGILGGDPRQPILVLQPGIGNGLLADFPTLLELWDALWNVGADELLKAYGLAEIARRAIRRARRARPTMEGKYEEWRADGVRPETLREFLGIHPWDLQQLARLLGCSVEQAEGLLVGFGYVEGEDKLWRPGHDEESRFLQLTLELIIHSPAVQRPYLVEVMEERLRELSTSGTTGEINWERLRDAPQDPEALERLGVTVHEAGRWRRIAARVRGLWWRMRYRG